MDARAILIPAIPQSPDASIGASEIRTRSQSTSQTPATSISSPDRETTSDFLVRVSQESIDAINRKDFVAAEGMAYLIDHDSFIAQLTDFGLVSSYQQHIDTYNQIYAMAPDIYLNVGETNITLDEQKGLASVYINVEAAGQPGGLATQGVSLLEWRKRNKDGDKKWLCIKHTALKGLDDIV